jgi:Elongation factor Tu GTP binding domain
MAIERERGISVSSAVMSFEHEGLAFDLLDTPGHQDSASTPVGFRWAPINHAGAIIAWYFCACRPAIGRAVRFAGSWRYLIST